MKILRVMVAFVTVLTAKDEKKGTKELPSFTDECLEGYERRIGIMCAPLKSQKHFLNGVKACKRACDEDYDCEQFYLELDGTCYKSEMEDLPETCAKK